MKTPFLFFFFIFSLTAFGQRAHFKTIHKILTDINDDGKMDTIIVSSSLKENDGFNRISVSLAGFNKKTFRARDGWTEIDKWFFENNKNAVNSRLIFLKKTNKHAVILLFGVLDGAGYRGEFSMVNIENNNSKMVFDHTSEDIDVEIPKTLMDLEHNDRLCFVYTSIGERVGYDVKTNSDLGTYTPYFVYPVTDTCKLNKPLTKKCNQENYVFAGFEYNDKIRVIYLRKTGKFSIYKK